MLSKFVFDISTLLLLILVLVNAEENGEVERRTSRPFPDIMYVFYHKNQMKQGNIFPFYFGTPFSTHKPNFLPKEKADKIPFSTIELPYILEYFGVDPRSEQAKGMEYVLKHCEFETSRGVVKFCATSLKSMIENVWKNVGPNTKSIKVVTTSPLPKNTETLQNYKVMSEPKEVKGSENMLGCHLMTYPYAVYFCHRPIGTTKVFEFELMSEDGVNMYAIATCHLDTFEWDENHDAFRFLGTKPGHPVCHIVSPDDLVWVPVVDSAASVDDAT